MFKFIKNIIKQLQCKHQYKFLFSYLVDTGMRKVCVFECKECGKIKLYSVRLFYETTRINSYYNKR
jgi:RNase P subunit RPR2